MPIIINGKVVDLGAVQQTPPTPAPTVVVVAAPSEQVVSAQPRNIVVEPTTEEQKTLQRKYVIERNKLKGVASSEASLLVNGRQRSIGRKSKYLLDMLTLDD
jgi:adenine-specific DNA glycosylase